MFFPQELHYLGVRLPFIASEEDHGTRESFTLVFKKVKDIKNIEREILDFVRETKDFIENINDLYLEKSLTVFQSSGTSSSPESVSKLTES
ncbi:MAG: hypothetical protein ACTSUE_26790 [Promethearchaeota archaeon]